MSDSDCLTQAGTRTHHVRTVGLARDRRDGDAEQRREPQERDDAADVAECRLRRLQTGVDENVGEKPSPANRL